jgi:hypothetical protein
MKYREHVLWGFTILAVGFVGYSLWNRNKTTKGLGPSLTSTGANATYISGNYSSMMRGQDYYNPTTLNGGVLLNSPEFADVWDYSDVATPWTIGSNGGDGAMVSGGMYAFPDTDAARSVNNRDDTNVAGSHL